MIDMIYNLLVGDIHAAEFSDEFNKLCIPFENSLNEEQIEVFHKILDCVSETALMKCVQHTRSVSRTVQL